MDEEIKREIIMQHYMQPEHRRDGEEKGYIKVNTANSSCIDNLDIFTQIEQGIIKDIYFHGEACAISTSSVSIMIKNLIGKRVEEALKFIENFESMINEEEYDQDLLKEANAYNEIYKQSNRKNCAYLPYKGIKKVLTEYLKKDTN